MIPEEYTGDRRQIGPRVHPALWEDFKAHAKATHGKRGMASRELEKAMYEYMADTGDGDDRGGVGTSERLDVLNAKVDTLLVAVNQSAD